MMGRQMRTLRSTRVLSMIALLMMVTLLAVVVVSLARSFHDEPATMPVRSSGDAR